MAETGDKIEPVILVHGGAGNIDNSRIANHLNGVRAAARTGYKVYSETSSILEATINAVKVLENDETFNAGRGSVLTYDGEIEMEALIMDGKTLKAGAVTLLKNIANPIEVARLVMEKTPHVLLSGNSAKKLATDYGIFHTDDSYFFTEKSKRALEKFHQERKKQEQSGTNEQPCDGETVGAIGIDANGNVVSCTSTGGRVGKITGRVGDTPIPGSGGYADNSIGTVSTTGNGDAILTYNLSLRIMTAMELGKSPQEAVDGALNGMYKMTQKTAGAIVLSKTGEVGIGFTTKGMSWAYIKNNKLYYGVEPGNNHEEEL